MQQNVQINSKNFVVNVINNNKCNRKLKLILDIIIIVINNNKLNRMFKLVLCIGKLLYEFVICNETRSLLIE